MADITLSIVTHNDADTIRKTVESILRFQPQKYSVRVLVVDNASTDGTLSILEEFPQLEIIRLPENIGFGSGHNQVLPLIDSRVHCIINPDIELTGDVLTGIYEYMQAHEEVALVQPVVRFPNGDVQHHPKLDPTVIDLFIRLFLPKRFLKRQARYMRLDMDPDTPFAIDVASGCFMAVRTDLFRKIGGFDQRFFLYFEDNDLSRRMREEGTLMQLPQENIIHYWNRASRRSKKILLIMFTSALKYFWKWKFKKKNTGTVNR